MILTIATTRKPAHELAVLMHKQPRALHAQAVGEGTAYVFFPEATAERCTAVLVADGITIPAAVEAVFGEALAGSSDAWPFTAELDGRSIPLSGPISLSDLLRQVVGPTPLPVEVRHAAVARVLERRNAKSVVCYGTDGGYALEYFARHCGAHTIVGVETSLATVERLRSAWPVGQRVDVVHGSPIYRDPRFADVDAVAILELTGERLDEIAFDAPTVVIATPQWSRDWLEGIAQRQGYALRCDEHVAVLTR